MRALRVVEAHERMEFGPLVGQHPAQPPTRTAIVRRRIVRRNRAAASAVCAGKSPATPWEQAVSHAVICHTLPTPLTALEWADVEGIQADQLARLAGLDVTHAPMPDPPELLPRALRQQARRLHAWCSRIVRRVELGRGPSAGCRLRLSGPNHASQCCGMWCSERADKGGTAPSRPNADSPPYARPVPWADR
jgi:hypothetical protein